MTLRCTEFGVQALAAQSILMRIFFFFACFGDAISQAAQAFLPGFLLHAKSNRVNFGRTVRKLMVLSAIFGIVNSHVSSFLLQHFNAYLTTDVGIRDILRQHSGFVGVSLVVHTIIMVLEGLVLASRDFHSLLVTYGITVTLHFGILKLLCESFTGVWKTFVVFQLTRLVLFSFRVVKRFQLEHTIG